MSLILSASKGLLRSVLPSRLLSVVTMATESSTEAAADLSAAFTTIGNAEAAEKLAAELVKQKLAACVNIIPGVKSIYEWKGNIETDQELILMIKTRTSKVDALSEFIRKNHPNEVAELITFPIQNGNLPYLQWVQQNVPK